MLLSNSTIDIGLRISLLDKFSKPAADIKAAMKGVRDEMQMYQDNLRAARNLYGGIAVAGAAAMGAMWSGFEKGAKFDYLIRGAGAAAGATGKELKELGQQASTLGSKLGFMPEDIASSMRVLGLAGIDAKGIMAGIKPIMNLAGGSMEDLSTSADIAISTMYQFGMQAKDLGYIGDALAQGTVKSNIALKDLAESLKYSASTAVLLKQDLPTVTGMIMTLGNAGIKGSTAGVAVENMYRYLGIALNDYKKTGGSKALARLGISPEQIIDAKGDLLPIVDIMDTLGKSISRFGTVKQGNFLFEIFGVRGKRGPATFIEDLGMLKKNIEYVRNSKGVSADLYEKQMSGPYGAMLKMKAAFQEMVIAFSQTLAPILIPFMQIVTKVLQGLKSFMDTAAGKIITPLLAGLTVMVTVVAALRAGLAALTMTLYSVRTSLGGINSALGIAKTSGLSGMLGLGSAGAFWAGGSATNQRVGGIHTTMQRYGSYGGRTYFGPAGNTAGAAAFTQNAAGQYIDPATGRFLSQQQVAHNIASSGLHSSTDRAAASMVFGSPGRGTFMGGLGRSMVGTGGMIAGSVGMSVGMGNMMAGESTGQRIGGGMQALGGGLMLFSPEPITKAIGLGLMVIGTGISMFSGSQDKNTDAVKENTNALKTDTLTRLRVTMGGRERLSWSEYANERMGQGSRSKENLTSLAQQLQLYLANPGAFGNKFIDTSNPNVINLYVGDQISKVINRQMNNTINANLMK